LLERTKAKKSKSQDAPAPSKPKHPPKSKRMMTSPPFELAKPAKVFGIEKKGDANSLQAPFRGRKSLAHNKVRRGK
jgi:hypothetical protein